jgi:ATP-dependent DNA helicase RecG
VPRAPEHKTILTPPGGDISLQYLKGVGPQRVKKLQALDISTVAELLRHWPRRYEERRLCPVSQLRDGDSVIVHATVAGSSVTQGRVKIVRLRLEQDGHFVDTVWFNQVFVAENFKRGEVVAVMGKVQWQNRIPEILGADITRDLNAAEEISAIYPETAGLNSKALRTMMTNALTFAPHIFPEYLPDNLLGTWLPRLEAFHSIHKPQTLAAAERARQRLVLEELLFLQLAMAKMRKPQAVGQSPVLNAGDLLVKRFVNSLPYRLTTAQTRVLKEITADMADAMGMSRLLQGDVGSGKTVVAVSALLQAVGSGAQGAFMVPTEVLAWQHYQTLTTMLSELPVQVVLLTGGQSKKDKENIYEQLRSGAAHIAVGTQALIQEKVEFDNLGLVITDEQHRFGVKQRSRLTEKGAHPHVLILTATPIPRTLALTAYGDLSLSVLDELPAGRKPILTTRISSQTRGKLWQALARETGKGRQVYIVCPFVAETETSDLASAEQKAEELRQALPTGNIALLHGQMPSAEKTDILDKFSRGEIDILVTTTVIEVGVNVPNATVMVIESAERFGLAQLHQLRGRVGRGGEQSYCLLISDDKDNSRLKILCETEDGFRIAEEDLRRRGPGELLGLKQHGLPELKLTDFAKDGQIVELAHQLAAELGVPGNELLWREVQKAFPHAGAAP